MVWSLIDSGAMHGVVDRMDIPDRYIQSSELYWSCSVRALAYLLYSDAPSLSNMASRFISKTLTSVFFLCVLARTGNATSCRNIPGDAGWPRQVDWAHLNKTVGGRLIATIPQASVCHTSPYFDYNETACEALAAGWDLAKTLYVGF